MKLTKGLIAAGVAAVMASIAAAPAAAQSSRQKDKNNMRNLGIGLGAAAAHQALKGKGTNALVLGAGAAYAGKKYEDSRKAQNRDNARYGQSGNRRVYVYRNGRRVGYYRYVNGRKVGYYRVSAHARR